MIRAKKGGGGKQSHFIILLFQNWKSALGVSYHKTRKLCDVILFIYFLYFSLLFLLYFSLLIVLLSILLRACAVCAATDAESPISHSPQNENKK